jgi:hypothetical protein
VWKHLSSVFEERDKPRPITEIKKKRKNVASKECIVEKILNKRWNNSLHRYEWQTKWIDGDVTWEPQDSFIDFENDEKVENDKWAEFENSAQTVVNETPLKKKRPTNKRITRPRKSKPVPDGDVTWEPQDAFIDFENDEKVENDKWAEFENSAQSVVNKTPLKKKRPTNKRIACPRKSKPVPGPESKKQLKVGNYSRREEEILLNPIAWVNDEIINVFFEILDSKFGKDYVFFNTFFYPSLCNYLEHKVTNSVIFNKVS